MAHTLLGVWKSEAEAKQLVKDIMAKPQCCKVDLVDLTGVRDDQSLFAAFARDLRFPAYFGNNWDALNDCLRDWVSEVPVGRPADGPRVMVICGADEYARVGADAAATATGGRDSWVELALDILQCMCRDAAATEPCCVMVAGSECKFAGNTLAPLDLLAAL
ncbi:hypothetical protein Pelo_13239 [Pelomyxa schiedti]|nr:hypothetical protein Pelo_13239 [Pelomyxa schiedti]